MIYDRVRRKERESKIRGREKGEREKGEKEKGRKKGK